MSGPTLVARGQCSGSRTEEGLLEGLAAATGACRLYTEAAVSGSARALQRAEGVYLLRSRQLLLLQRPPLYWSP